MTSKSEKKSEITAQQVRDYIAKHPDVLHDLALPERDMGEGVVDFQHHLLKSLQRDTQSLKGRYELLVDYCRDNLSAQQQVHQAVLRLGRAHGLEQLLEVVALDLVTLFDVDVVRLAMESDLPFDTSYGEEGYSGIVFVTPGMIDAMFTGHKKNVMLVGDCVANPPVGFEEVFADCEQMIASCAFLRLHPESVDRDILLAFGVRHAQRYHDGQGTELLAFLAQMMAVQLDKYLDDLTL
jgi:uncharacterized protein